MNNDITTDTRPLGYWISAVDRLLAAEFATVFADEGITRREWRMLNLIDGTTPGSRPEPDTGSARTARLPHAMRGPKLRRLIDLGWISRDADGWTLTDAGRLAKSRLGSAVDEIRARFSAAVSPEELAAMTASLEKVAREFGWEAGMRLPRRHGQHNFGCHNDRHHDRRHGFSHRSRTPEQHIHIHTHS
ncbi:hypothetical protein FM104_01105 [Microbacterium esteraromaticum]|uniref:MarR family transcriptional regulator n=1 Tax=Microbacterium esteraromaticum TaxID=57043 RepID=A0A1R4IAW2_9MICO|nr:hypothetical protein [Microbacterium esteraromaticum]SJN16879.1 hypothetical protein FM104_01105 [Microbacterium esteraromaticum]